MILNLSSPYCTYKNEKTAVKSSLFCFGSTTAFLVESFGRVSDQSIEKNQTAAFLYNCKQEWAVHYELLW